MSARLAILSCAAALAAASCDGDAGRGGSSGGTVLAAAADSNDVFATVGAFDLVDQEGRAVRRDDLLGRPWVASFVFTRCTGPCPRVASTLRELQRRLDPASPARIVTFSVDPEHDVPAVLADYARSLEADPARWTFLTGSEEAIERTVREGFLSPLERAPEGTPVGLSVSHRTQLVAVDSGGRVRGYYSGETTEDLDLLIARLDFLAREPGTSGR